MEGGDEKDVLCDVCEKCDGVLQGNRITENNGKGNTQLQRIKGQVEEKKMVRVSVI